MKPLQFWSFSFPFLRVVNILKRWRRVVGQGGNMIDRVTEGSSLQETNARLTD
jgi:hypothetical protein